MSKWIDVDAHLAEMDDEPIIVLINGEKMEFPSQAPAALIYKVLRMMDEDGNVTLNEMPQFWNMLIGEKKATELLDGGLSWDGLLYIQTELLSAWGIGAGAEDAPEGDPPETP